MCQATWAPGLWRSLVRFCGEIREAAGAGRGERLREGLAVAIAGPPNVGKSTLLNRLARREAAIVSPHAGTTRDVIEVHLDLGGYPVILRDTAGLRDATDPVEQEGVRRARDAVLEADLVLWVVDAASGKVVAPGRTAGRRAAALARPQQDGLAGARGRAGVDGAAGGGAARSPFVNHIRNFRSGDRRAGTEY